MLTIKLNGNIFNFILIIQKVIKTDRIEINLEVTIKVRGFIFVQLESRFEEIFLLLDFA